MKNVCICLAVLFLVRTVSFAQQTDGFSIRGVLPWHNFLSGPTAWNEQDYIQYLDVCAKAGINFIGFHNYTGGGERYATYVEPMIKISVNHVLPAAFFDHSGSSRWGYYPMKVRDFAYGTAKAFSLPGKADYFGADCSILSRTNEEQYQASQTLMQKVLKHAHDRNMQMAMGFEFGVLPPEYFSLNDGSGSFYWPGESNMIPNPTHHLSVQLLYNTIDDILTTYKGIDWIWLWLNEHSFMGVNPEQALKDSTFRTVYERDGIFFTEAAADEKAKFIGVWSMQYLRLASDYIRKKAPGVKIMLGGWGGGNQLPVILKGLDRGLPKDIVFSCLNPDLGNAPQPAFLSEIARNRSVMAIPWLEGDHQLWHYQPRVKLMRDHVMLARQQQLDGVIAIHWRTKETQINLHAFSHYAMGKDSCTVSELYRRLLTDSCGTNAANELTPLFAEMDSTGFRYGSLSPEYYAYTPKWGQMTRPMKEQLEKVVVKLEVMLKKETRPQYQRNLKWFRDTFVFELLLDETGRCIEPAWDLRKKSWQAGQVPVDSVALKIVSDRFRKAPIEKLFKLYMAKANSRGELGILSSLNQKLYTEYLSLHRFLVQQQAQRN